MKLLAVFATVTALMVAPAACAGDVEVHGNVYLHYRSVLSSESWKGYNAFDISRAHLTFTGPLSRMEKVGRRMRFDITTDLTRLSELGQSGTQSVAGSAVVIPEAEANGYLMRFIKHAYLEIEGVRPGLSVRFGQSPAPWVPYEEQIWGFRWIERSFGNLEGKLSEAELGFSALYSFLYGLDRHAMTVGDGKRIERIVCLVPVLSASDLPRNSVPGGLLVPSLHQSLHHDDHDIGHGQDNDIEPCPQPGTQQVS